MGRYTYNSSVVTNALAELNDALNVLTNVEPEIQTAINTITNATGAQFLEIKFDKLRQLQTLAEDAIEDDIKNIKEKVSVIEDYENAPWYKKLFSSIGMGISKFAEGVASGLENITDGAVSIVGFFGGIFNSEFKNCVAEYVAKDHVGDWFDKQYDEGFLRGIEKYSWFGEDSTAANIFKGFGTAAPYIALSMTGVGTTVEVAAAALGGIGSGTEAGINQALMHDPNLKAGDVFNMAFGKGIVQGAKNAALVYAMNKIRDVAVQKANTPRITDGTNPGQGLTTSEKVFTKAGNFADTKVGGAINAADDFVVNAGQKAGQAIQKVPGVTSVTNAVSTKADKIWNSVTSSKIINNKVVKGITTSVTNTVKAHPGAAYATAGTLFALDQVGEDVINSEYRIQQEQLDEVKIRTAAPLTPDPTYGPPKPDDTPNDNPNNGNNGNPNNGNNGNPNNGDPNNGNNGNPNNGNNGNPNNGNNGNPNNGNNGNPNNGGTTKPSVTTPTKTPTPTEAPTPTPTQNHQAPTTPSTGVGQHISGGIIGEGGTEGEFDFDVEVEDEITIPEEMTGSITEIVGENNYTNIPTSSTPITTTPITTGNKKSIIPVIAGLGSAAVAGIGAKAYLDKKEAESDSTEEDFDTEDWTEDSVDIDYSEAMEEDSDYLSPTDEFAYQEEGEDTTESYEAVNSSELASMQ